PRDLACFFESPSSSSQPRKGSAGSLFQICKYQCFPCLTRNVNTAKGLANPGPGAGGDAWEATAGPEPGKSLNWMRRRYWEELELGPGNWAEPLKAAAWTSTSSLAVSVRLASRLSDCWEVCVFGANDNTWESTTLPLASSSTPTSVAAVKAGG